jgi:hypothetical protein
MLDESVAVFPLPVKNGSRPPKEDLTFNEEASASKPNTDMPD